ncbi:MAG: hypothetical protein JNL83_10185 [Myxococcales bacterium]|nr:hypothetical protein [Myxococcales bacterium]
MTRAQIVLFVLVTLAACKKTSKTDDRSALPAPLPADPPPVAVVPLPPARPGPAYVAITGRGIARLDPDGWKVIGEHHASIALGGDTIWGISAQRVWRLDDSWVERAAPGPITSYAAASDGTLWVISDGKLLHLVGETWTPEVLPGGDPPRGVAADGDVVWVRTLDRTYRRRGGAWTAIDVPTVTGSEQDILDFAARGDDAYLVTNREVFRFDGTTWKPVRLGRKLALGDRALIFAGPGGRFAISDDNLKLAGNTESGLRPLDIGGMQLHPSLIWLSAIDDRGRIWATADAGNVFVFDETGKRIKRWTQDDAPILAGRPFQIAVVGGGPLHLDSGERVAVTVTGKVEGSASGVEIVACAQRDSYGSSPPCEGVWSARSTRTAPGGAFTLAGVPLAPTYFWVKRGGRWRKTAATGCCDKLQPDAAFDVGTLRLE